jgi:hypothetical protein
MPVGNNNAILAAQIEKVQPNDLEELYALDSVLWGKIKARPKDTVSTRPERVVFNVYPGGKSRQVTLDGDDLGRGGAPQFAYGTIAPYAFLNAFEWTELSKIATDNREKAVVDYFQKVLKTQSEIGGFVLDSLLAVGDGANTLGTVVSYDSTNHIIYVDNAARFYAGQDVDYYATGVGTAFTETITILGVDPVLKALYLSANPATNPVANGVLLLNQSSGTANSGLAGVTAYNTTSTTGNYMTGVSRSTYPGAFNTPYVDAGTTALSPANARLLLSRLKLASGVKSKPSGTTFAHMGLDQRTAWENAGIVVTQLIQSGNATARDMLAPSQVETIAGIPILTNNKAVPGRIDLLDFSTWYRTEVSPLDFYEVNGNRIFALYGASGAPASSQWSAMYWMGNVVCDNPRKNAMIINLTIPTGF